MNTFNRKGALVASALVMGLIATQSANAQIRNTKHNFAAAGANSSSTYQGGSGNAIHINAGGNNDEICIYCHTPHGANMKVTAPLWNKSLSPAAINGTYTTYTSGTMQGVTTGLSDQTAKHMSLACLACHDGTQAMDNMINNTGSDNYATDGGGASGSATSSSWSSANTIGTEVNAQGFMQGNGSNTSSMGLSSGNGVTNHAGTVAMLSPDLSNDHPIAMEYCGGGASNGGTGSCADPYFNIPTGTATGPGLAGGNIFVSNSAATVTLGGADKGLRLYPSAAYATVECGSCHDPHTETTTFLRLTNGNSGSQVCLTCHNK